MRTLGTLLLLALGPAAHAERTPHGEDSDFEHRVVIGVGGAIEVDLPGGKVQGGGNLMIEVMAIEDWLEFELGASLLAGSEGMELPIDLLIKKPFRLSRRIEMMIGLGPEMVWIHGTPREPRGGVFFGGELALDFMFWPSRHVGLWVEPSYDLIGHDGPQSSLGATGGVIFGP